MILYSSPWGVYGFCSWPEMLSARPPPGDCGKQPRLIAATRAHLIIERRLQPSNFYALRRSDNLPGCNNYPDA